MKQITFLIFIVFSISINGQKIIKGTITDGEISLPFATVSIKNTNVGVVADKNGYFSIKAKRGDELLISYLGFKPKTVTIKKNKNLSIHLISDNYLEEVVVVGYQTTKMRHTTVCLATRIITCDGFLHNKNKVQRIKETNNRLYPNPSLGGRFQFKLNPEYSNVTILITNLAGQNINSFAFKKMDNVSVNLSNLPKGIYLFTIYNNGKRVETLKGVKG